MRIQTSVVVFLAVLLFSSEVLADSVSVPFNAVNCFVLDANGERVDTDSFPYKFKSLKFGGRCGTEQKKYENGANNNYLKRGLNCLLTGKLVSSGKKSMAKKAVIVTNEKGTTRASQKTSSSGNFNMTWKVLANNPQAYILYGPKVASQERVGCTVYRFDHLF